MRRGRHHTHWEKAGSTNVRESQLVSTTHLQFLTDMQLHIVVEGQGYNVVPLLSLVPLPVPAASRVSSPGREVNHLPVNQPGFRRCRGPSVKPEGPAHSWIMLSSNQTRYPFPNVDSISICS